MRMVAAAVAATLVALAGASSAVAGWSAPRPIQTSPYAAVDLAVNARGDAVVAWATRGSPAMSPTYGTTVHVTVRTFEGRMSTRTVWSSHRSRVDGIAVALDRRGEITVAWVSSTRRGQTAPGGTRTVRAAYGPLVGRWTPPRVVGEGMAQPRLAVAPDDDVLLVWADGSSPRQRAHGIHAVAVAWRAPGHRFGAPQALSRPRPVSTPYTISEAIPVFDAGGTAYLTGPCDGVVRMALPHRHRFGRPIAVARGAVLGFGLSVSQAGRGVASWVTGKCTSDVAVGNTPGRVFASLLRDGTFGEPLALPSSADVFATNPLIVPGDGRTVSWSEPGPERSGVFSVLVGAGAGGAVGPARPIPDGMIPFVADGGGDQVIAQAFGGPPATFGVGGVAVRPAGGGADQPSPAPDGADIAVSTPAGRRVALLWTPRTLRAPGVAWRCPSGALEPAGRTTRVVDAHTRRSRALEIVKVAGARARVGSVAP